MVLSVTNAEGGQSGVFNLHIHGNIHIIRSKVRFPSHLSSVVGSLAGPPFSIAQRNHSHAFLALSLRLIN